MAGFMQKRFPNGTFAPEDPVDCSPHDQQADTRQCSLQSGNTVGFFESSSWEYSWFAPHDTAHLITLMGGNVSQFTVSVPHIRCQPLLACLFFGICRQLSLSDSITSSTLATTWPGMSHLSRYVYRSPQFRLGLDSQTVVF